MLRLALVGLMVGACGRPLGVWSRTDARVIDAASDADAAPDAAPDAQPPDCLGGDPELILGSFVACPGSWHVGQARPVDGVTCTQVCACFGFHFCSHRATQSDFEACEPPVAPQSGDCDDPFAPSWSSQCACGFVD